MASMRLKTQGVSVYDLPDLKQEVIDAFGVDPSKQTSPIHPSINDRFEIIRACMENGITGLNYIEE